MADSHEEDNVPAMGHMSICRWQILLATLIALLLVMCMLAISLTFIVSLLEIMLKKDGPHLIRPDLENLTDAKIASSRTAPGTTLLANHKVALEATMRANLEAGSAEGSTHNIGKLSPTGPSPDESAANKVSATPGLPLTGGIETAPNAITAGDEPLTRNYLRNQPSPSNPLRERRKGLRPRPKVPPVYTSARRVSKTACPPDKLQKAKVKRDEQLIALCSVTEILKAYPSLSTFPEPWCNALQSCRNIRKAVEGFAAENRPLRWEITDLLRYEAWVEEFMRRVLAQCRVDEAPVVASLRTLVLAWAVISMAFQRAERTVAEWKQYPDHGYDWHKFHKPLWWQSLRIGKECAWLDIPSLKREYS